MQGNKTSWIQWLKTILILPVNVIIVLPAIVLFFTKHHSTPPPAAFLLPGGLFFLTGFFFALRTMKLFNDKGHGTVAPWCPPENLVTSGPYAHVRNPMILSVLLMLTGESLFFRSAALAIYTVAFFLLNCIYFRLFEEKQLEKRFGSAYLEYKKSTPMWLPAIRPRRCNTSLSTAPR